MVTKKKGISLIIQEGHIKALFPNSKVVRDKEFKLTWIHCITPSPLSSTYKVKLEYIKGGSVNVYVLEPYPLLLAQGKTNLPHTYCTKKQQLCLFFPDSKIWNNTMLYTKTIIPWACEWLLHYELWVGTGKWHGGGINHNENNIK